MGYIFLLFALLSGAAKGFCGKKTSAYMVTLADALLVNMLRMALCVVIAFIMIMFNGEFNQFLFSSENILIAAFSGVTTSVFVVSWLIAVKKSAYMLLDVFLMLGVLIPLVASDICFNEEVTLTQWSGILLLFIAVFLLCSYNNKIKGKFSVFSYIPLFVCGFANGLTDFSQKVFVKNAPDVSVTVFNFYVYVFALLTLLIIFPFIKNKKVEITKRNFSKISGYVLVMSVCLFMNSLFKTLAAQGLDSVLLYPLNQGGSLILSTFMASTFFGEKLNVKAFMGIIIAFVGLIVINML